MYLSDGARPAEGVPEEIGREADLIMEWVDARGQAWHDARLQRQREARDADQRRQREAAAAAARQQESDRAAAARLAQEVKRQEDLARRARLIRSFSVGGDGAGGVDVGGEVGAMDVDGGDKGQSNAGELGALSGVAATASTGGTVGDDEGEDEHDSSADEAPAVGVGVAAAHKEAEAKRTAAERVEFIEGVHQVRAASVVLGVVSDVVAEA